MNTNTEDRDINQMDTNTQPESRAKALTSGEIEQRNIAFTKVADRVGTTHPDNFTFYCYGYADGLANDSVRAREYQHGYECGRRDAGLAARSPRDEDAVDATNLCPQCNAADNRPYVAESGISMRACGRCCIQWRDGSWSSPHPVERGTK